MRSCLLNGLLAVVGVVGVVGFSGVAAGQTPAADAGAAAAQPAQPAAPKPLSIGDPAPALEIAEWVKGKPVTAFEKGRVYVVEFWATWCGPCRAGIPKLSDLQAKYKDKVTIIGVSIDQNGMEAVRPFMDGMFGKKMEYTVALDKGGTVRSYMQAVNKSGIPYAFVVDGGGKVAWHGHPADSMDLVIMEAAAGKFDAVKHPERMSKFREMDAKFGTAFQAKQWDEAEKTLDEIAVMRPDLANNLWVTRYKIMSAGRGDPTAAVALAQRVAGKELKTDEDMLVYMADYMVGTPTSTPAEIEAGMAIARQAGELSKGTNATVQIILAEGYKRQGKHDEAIAAAKKAAELAGDEEEKGYYMMKVAEIERMKGAGKP